MTDKPAFEVRGLDGSAYRIWADGRIDGFGPNPGIIINRIPTLINSAVHEERLVAEKRARSAARALGYNAAAL